MMRPVASIAILSVVVVGSIGVVETYDGKIKITDVKLNDLVIGDKFSVE